MRVCLKLGYFTIIESGGDEWGGGVVLDYKELNELNIFQVSPQDLSAI